MLLGMKTVKLMALSFSLAGSLPKQGKQGSFDFAAYWHKSLVCAIAARSLARLVKSPYPDEAFLCGLFAHFGKLVLMRCLPQEYELVVSQAQGWPTNEREEEQLGIRSTDACVALLRSWELPTLIHATVGAWSRPLEIERLEDPPQRQLAQLLSLANLAERVLCEPEKGAALGQLHADMARLFHVPENEVNALLVGLESGINEAAELLAIALPSGTSHEELVNQARMQMMNVSLGTAVDLAAAQRRNQELETEKKLLATRATTDKLTGLPNRAAFDAFLEQEVRARTTSVPSRALGLVMVDVDHFKRFNDTYGHQVGDEVLRMVGGLLGRMTRKGDLSARYGGEEFAIIVPQTNPFGLRTLAERLRQAIEAEVLEVDGKPVSVTASLGGACIARFGGPSDGAALIKLADHYLYKAKKNGRNRCELYPKLEFPG
jgi:diguanylate cyclase (GGDEF)-like protein